MEAIVHAADIQDRDSGVVLMSCLFGLYPFLLKLFADAGYQGAQFQDGLRKVLARVQVEVVKRSDQVKGLWFCPSGGLWNARLPGSAVAAAWPRTGRT